MSRKSNTQVIINKLYNLILNGATSSNLLEYLSDTEFTNGEVLTQKQKYEHIQKARWKIRDDFKEESKELRESNLNRLLDLYAESREIGDRLAALNALKEMNKLCGLYEPTKVEGKLDLSGDITIDFKLNDNNDKEEEKDES